MARPKPSIVRLVLTSPIGSGMLGAGILLIGIGLWFGFDGYSQASAAANVRDNGTETTGIVIGKEKATKTTYRKGKPRTRTSYFATVLYKDSADKKVEREQEVDAVTYRNLPEPPQESMFQKAKLDGKSEEEIAAMMQQAFAKASVKIKYIDTADDVFFVEQQDVDWMMCIIGFGAAVLGIGVGIAGGVIVKNDAAIALTGTAVPGTVIGQEKDKNVIEFEDLDGNMRTVKVRADEGEVVYPVVLIGKKGKAIAAASAYSGDALRELAIEAGMDADAEPAVGGEDDGDGGAATAAAPKRKAGGKTKAARKPAPGGESKAAPKAARKATSARTAGAKSAAAPSGKSRKVAAPPPMAAAPPPVAKSKKVAAPPAAGSARKRVAAPPPPPPGGAPKRRRPQ